MGYSILLSEDYTPNVSSRCFVSSWNACKIKRIVNSTYDTETIALELGLEEAIVIIDQILKMTCFSENLIEIESFVDCKDTYEAIISNKQFPKGSRLASLEITKIKEMVEKKQIQRVNWVDTSHQLAEYLPREE